MNRTAPYVPISDYALIGDCHSTALVDRHGSIDWACLKRLDSGAVFARLLDAQCGGHFAISPPEAEVSRRYLPDTNVLETTFTTPSGQARLLDCFTMRRGGRKHPHGQLLRIVECTHGTVQLDVHVQPRFDYGSLRPWLRYHEGKDLFSAVGGDDAFVLSCDCELSLDRDRGTIIGKPTMRAGDCCRFSLLSADPFDMRLERQSAEILDERLRRTIEWWRDWVARGRYTGELKEQVTRSSLALKLLTCAPTGAIIAAATTSLPEALGGTRNWDYRYSWVRDSTMTLGAFLSIGRPEIATGFKQFIERATAGHAEDLQIMYGCYGERRLPELEVEDLEGYRGSRPVRVGNGAASQKQLDVYGELLDAANLWSLGGSNLTEDGWRFLRGLVDMACARWREPDQGMWESRAAPQHYVHSKAMCWLAIERGIELAGQSGFPADVDKWRAELAAVRESIETYGVDKDGRYFVQAYGTSEVDASLLRLPIIGFVSANDPRMQRTVERIVDQLTVGRLLRRYRNEATDDGLAGGEGAFLMTSFWLVDVLTMQGKLDEAESLLRYLVGLANDVGLYSEEYDASSGLFLGNFPQAFTHLELISAAQQVSRARAGDGHTLPLSHRPTAPREEMERTGRTTQHGPDRRDS